MVSFLNYPETWLWISLKSKDIQFKMLKNKERWYSLTFENLEPEAVLYLTDSKINPLLQLFSIH